MNSPVGPPCFVPLARDYGVLGFQSPSPVPDTLCLSSILCAFPQYSVVVLDTPHLSSIRCACPKYARPVLDTLCLSYIRRTCPRYAVPVRDTLCLSLIRWAVLSLCLSLIRCASSRYAVPVVNTLSWPFAVPLTIGNWILTLIPLYTYCLRFHR